MFRRASWLPAGVSSPHTPEQKVVVVQSSTKDLFLPAL
jgi:hypothetical protein